MHEIEIKQLREDNRTREAYKTLRTNVEFSDRDKKVLVFTSCIPGEGKSTTSLMLARSLEDDGKKVLLIDADMRKSSLIRYFETDTELRGLSHFLTDQAKIGEILCRVKDSELYVIFAGPMPPNPTELLGGWRFDTLIKSVRENFDYVLVDTPALGSVVDGAVVAEKSDAAIMLIEAGEVNRKFAQEVMEQLKQSGCPILGAVLNKESKAHNKFYGKYYGKYYGRYGED